jgi:hypothetical protein
MSNAPNINRLLGGITPPASVQSDAERRSAEISRESKDDWSDALQLMTESDCRLRSDLFNDPPAKFIARIWDGSLVYGVLIQNDLLNDRQCLGYLMTRNHHSTVVYVYSGRSAHQRWALEQFYDFGDWRIVPTSRARASSELHIKSKCAWELLPFHVYFDFQWFPEGNYYDGSRPINWQN